MVLTPMPRARTHRAERQFGLSVGVVLAAVGGWWIFRAKFVLLGPWFAGLGAVLVVLGLLYPRALVWPSRGWMTMAEGLSFVMTRVVLAIVFFIVVTPIGVIKRITGWDPLRRRAGRAASYWAPYPERQRDPKHYEKMF